MHPEMPENFTNMFGMIGRVGRVDQDVVEVNDDGNIQEVTKNVVHKTLEGGGCIGESERHNCPFKRAVASAESSLPFITFSYANKVIGVPEVKGHIDASFTSSGKEIVNKGKWITVLLRDLIKATEIDTKSKRAILFSDKEDQSSMGGGGGSNESNFEVLIDKFLERLEF